jgi:hypothetical protein
MILAAAAMAAAVGAAGVASATTFSGSYSPTVYSGNNGLEIETFDTTSGTGTGFTFNLVGNGASTDINLFRIWTDEGSVDNSDEIHRPISVLFSFTAPGVANGTVGGETFGIDGTVNRGHVTWNGPAVINFGGALGTITVTLNDTDFNSYDPPGSGNNDDLREGYNYSAQVTGHFALSNVVAGAGAVPEPATWGMMIMGFGLAGATMRRRRTLAAVA